MRFRPKNREQFVHLAVAATLFFAGAKAAPPEIAILWVVDGISYQAPERVQLKNLQALMAQGVYYRQNYTVQTADPSNQPGMWADPLAQRRSVRLVGDPDAAPARLFGFMISRVAR